MAGPQSTSSRRRRRGSSQGDLSLPSEAAAERGYALLIDGGQVFMTMEKTPFANRFAMLRDKFGTSWMLLHQPEEDAPPARKAGADPWY